MTLFASIVVACAFAQDPVPPEQTALTRAIAVEEREHDLRAAAGQYRAIAENDEAVQWVRSRAWLRLGKVLLRLRREDDARAALTEAVKLGGEPAREARLLLARDDRDVTQDRNAQLREKARDILGEAKWPRNAERDLLWIGEPAVPELISAFEAAMAAVNEGHAKSASLAQRIAALIWRIGGGEAERFLAGIADSEDHMLRSIVVHGGRKNANPSMTDAAAQFLLDPDDTGRIPITMLGAFYMHLPTASLMNLLRHDHVDVRVQAWETFRRRWGSLRHRPNAIATARAITPLAFEAVEDVDPKVGQAAMQFLRSGWPFLAAEGREMWLRSLPSLPLDANVGNWPTSAGRPNQHADAVAAVVRETGENNGSNRARSLVEFVRRYCLPHWSDAAVPTVMELIRHGYAPTISDWLAQRDLPADAWPILKDHLDRDRVGGPVDGNLAIAAARTGSGEVGTWIVDCLQGNAQQRVAAVRALTFLSDPANWDRYRRIDLGRCWQTALRVDQSMWTWAKHVLVGGPDTGTTVEVAGKSTSFRYISHVGATNSTLLTAFAAELQPWLEGLPPEPFENPPGEEAPPAWSVAACLVRIANRATDLTEPAQAALHRFEHRCLTHPNPTLRILALRQLGRTIAADTAQLVASAIVDPIPEVATAAIRAAGDSDADLPPDRLGFALRHTDPTVRAAAIDHLAHRVAGSLEQVTARLADPDAVVRIAACQHLGKAVDRSSVPKLLAALKDPDTDVRDAAEWALRAIRFYHEQREHWEGVFGATPATTATARLLAQAHPDQPREVRLLAIASLGHVGAIDALPDLIEWSQSDDPAIVTATRDAISRIHGKASGGK